MAEKEKERTRELIRIRFSEMGEKMRKEVIKEKLKATVLGGTSSLL